ncbi:MAG: phosphate ABC transporter permease PstA [Alphaproteobacteria bacterium]|nr:MAG: phosphate ABC transporter permease PstA [Alphaproteobacteria bacterium]
MPRLHPHPHARDRHRRRRKLRDRLADWIGFGSVAVVLSFLLAVIVQLALTGAPRLNMDFLMNLPSSAPDRAGILPAWIGSLMLAAVCMLVAVPLGVGAGVYMEEYAPQGGLTRILDVTIATLAGVPSVVFGLLGLALFVNGLDLGRSILSGGLTLALLVLPMVTLTTRESLRAVHQDLREAALALGASPTHAVTSVILPAAAPGILTGVILALARALGETAPLILVGAVAFISFTPSPPILNAAPYLSLAWLHEPFTVLPMQMFNWVSRPGEAFRANAAAAGLVLLAVTVLLNAGAIFLRAHLRRKRS